MIKTRRSLNFLISLIFLQLVVYVTVFFDIPTARQVIGFVYFTFVPGIIIFKLLRFDKLDKVEILLLSVGFSVAFLMFGGLLLNELGPLFGLSDPLSLMPLMIVLNSFILIGGILVYLRGESNRHSETKSLGLNPLALLLAVLPILSIVGAMYVNVFDSNLILLFLMIAITLLFAVVVVSRKLSSSNLYPLAILMLAISLLFQSSLISRYIIPFGSDSSAELYIFKTTQNGNHWIATNPYGGDLGYGRLNAMLSITILPTVYSNALNIDPTWVFKILIPLIFSLVPLGLYQVWQRYFGKKYAFIAAFFFMSQQTFFMEMLGLNRQIIAELFFVLILLVLLQKEIKPINKILCFTIFSAALVTSHYAIAEIVLLFLFVALISSVIIKRPSRNITTSMVVLLFVIMFSWYIYTSSSTVFDSFLSFGSFVSNQLGEFFNLSSRGQTLLLGLGVGAAPSIWNFISRLFVYVTEALIVVGFIAVGARAVGAKRAEARIERDYVVFCFVAMAFLALLILIPGLAGTLNITRFYHILLFFLAPLCVLGVQFLVRLISRRKEELLVSVLMISVLVPFFLFQTGFVYEVRRTESYSVPLSGYRMDPLQLGWAGYTDTPSVFGAQWLSKNIDNVIDRSKIYSDAPSLYNVLTSYGLLPPYPYTSVLSNTTTLQVNSTIYLNTLNTRYDVTMSGAQLWNLSELSFAFSDLNKVYSNGGSEVYLSTP